MKAFKTQFENHCHRLSLRLLALLWTSGAVNLSSHLLSLLHSDMENALVSLKLHNIQWLQRTPGKCPWRCTQLTMTDIHSETSWILTCPSIIRVELVDFNAFHNTQFYRRSHVVNCDKRRLGHLVKHPFWQKKRKRLTDKILSARHAGFCHVLAKLNHVSMEEWSPTAPVIYLWCLYILKGTIYKFISRTQKHIKAENESCWPL